MLNTETTHSGRRLVLLRSLQEERRPDDSRWEVEVLDATFDLELLIEMPNIGAGSGTAD
jgi:hypothetical protein